jgi:hypothetical protein
MHDRTLSVLAGTLAALALAAAPALAGEDDDGDDDVASPQVQNVPAPAGAPQGGVATGLGGTAPQGPGEWPLALFTGSGLLLTGAGAVVVARRRPA